MPSFIRTNSIIEVNRHGAESDRQVLFSRDEAIERIRLNPSLVIEVTESHAAQTIRKQGKYQEITEEMLAEAKPVPLTKPARKGKVSDSNKSSLKFTPVEDDES